MVKDQLFKNYPTSELLSSIFSAFGITELEQHYSFSRNDLKHLQTVKKINMLKPYLEKCYIPCKARTYLNNLTEKNVVTVLRQMLRLKGYCLTSKEKYIKGYKFILYRLEKADIGTPYTPIKNPNSTSPQIKDTKPIIITFN